MNAYAWPFGVTTVVYAVFGLWVIANRQSRLHRLYGMFCITTCLWQGIWAVLFGGIPAEHAYFSLRLCYTGIVFLPAVFYSFILELTSEPRDQGWRTTAFLVGIVLAVMVWFDPWFINGFNRYSWGMAARAGIFHPIFTAMVFAVVLRTLILLARYQANNKPQQIGKQVAIVKTATLIYCGGAFDLVSNYGISIFPMSFLSSGLAISCFGYAMFKYEFMAISASREPAEDRFRREAASEEMRRHGVVAAFPLVTQGEVLGYLLLGEKKSEARYSREDLLLLRIVANQAALAYQRVRYLEMAVHGARTEMLGEIAGGFAHEMKTPLANITLPAELSLMELSDVEGGKKTIQEVMPELKENLKQIMEQAFKASDKIEAIRQFSKPGQILLEAVELPKVVQGSLSILDHVLRKLGTEVRADVSATLPPVRGNAKQLEIVFVNLMKNAAEAMAGMASPALARRLELRANEEGEWITVRVKDSGPGIKRTDFAHLFEAYFTTKGSTGTGMGLFLSHQVIKAHGGSIDVKSEEGQGTEFIIKLPKFAAKDHTNVFKAA
jgi:signal transduction histidine kinase